jgi:hypothetical protein
MILVMPCPFFVARKCRANADQSFACSGLNLGKNHCFSLNKCLACLWIIAILASVRCEKNLSGRTLPACRINFYKKLNYVKINPTCPKPWANKV